ncbi:MAG: AMP-binding protein [Opitutales bacterium]
METTAPFDLKALRRDWIAGTSGEDFYRRVLQVRASLDPGDTACLIQEADPFAFAVQFFAAAALRLPVVLANPKWGAREAAQFDHLLQQEAPAAGTILIPTGGTTGGVKLAIHDWASLEAGALAVQDFLGGGPVDACCVLPLYHVSGLMQLLRSFVSGGSIRFDEEDPEGRCLSLVPTQLQRLMQSPKGIRKLNTAGTVFVGGAAMPRTVEQKARELKLPVVPVYGMTETAAMIAAVPKQDFLSAPDAGAVLLGDARVGIDPDACIRVHSSSLFKGYHGSARIDRAEGYRTGDAGWLDEQGRLHLQGRMDRLINTGGEKVDPAEVEEALLRIDGIAEARVYGEPDEEWGEVVVAYLKQRTDAPRLSEPAILSSLKQQLSPYKIPKYVRSTTKETDSPDRSHI